VLVARDLQATMQRLEDELRLRDPFHDDGVGHFGLANAVYAVGDTFLEVVSPQRPDTAAGRELDRRGSDGGYMAMFQVSDVAAARHRLSALGVRVVWETAHDDIVDLHLHPKDVPGAIVAVDVVDPPGSWRWGGPAWTAAVPAHAAGGLRGLTVAADDADGTAARWAAVVGAEAGGREIALDAGRQRVEFVDARDDRRGIVAVSLTLPDGVPRTVDVAGVRFDVVTEQE
jgi:hypothetical protein